MLTDVVGVRAISPRVVVPIPPVSKLLSTASSLRSVQVVSGVRLACDVGAARIGIAVCDRDGFLATARDAIPAGPQSAALVASAAAEIGAIEIVVGMPINLDGSRGKAAESIDAWVAELSDLTDIPIAIIDERLSTVQAQRRLHESGRTTRDSRSLIDSAAAAILLESHLDRLRGGGGT